MDAAVALRLDDVGAASKRHEVYGVTRVRVGTVAVPFPGNLLFLKYVPPIKRWGPYPEIAADQWERILAALARTGARMTVAVTAGWVERDGAIVPFPRKFPDAARVLRQGVADGLLEVANHGYTHCVVKDGLFLPRLFSGNRPYHREFYDWLPEETHREHLERAQDILSSWLGAPIETFVPPGDVLSPKAVAVAPTVGIRFISRTGGAPPGGDHGVTFVDEARVRVLHDRDLVRRGLGDLERRIDAERGSHLVTVAELGRLQQAAT